MNIYWFCCEATKKDFFQQALEEFSEQMRSHDPAAMEIDFVELSPEAAELAKIRTTGGFLGDDVLSGKRVLIYCAADCIQAVQMRRNNSMAEWGGTQDGMQALVWNPNKFLVWHETLHLLDCEDCYDKQGDPTCEEKRCIMQYAPSDRNCGNGLFLCKENKLLIHNRLRVV